MNYTTKKINDSECEMEITLTRDELAPHYEAAYAKVAPKLNMPGFRKGKVPRKLVMQMIGKELQADAEDEAINQAFSKIVMNDKLKIIGQPHVHDIKHEDEDIVFTLHYEVIPEFELAEYKGITIDEPVHNVEDEEVEKEIANILKQNGSFEDDSEILSEEYVVGIKLNELDSQSGLPIIGGKTEETHIYLANETVLPNLKDLLIGKKTGDTFNFRPSDSDKLSTDKLYSIEVFDIQKLIPAEFTNEFVENFTKGKFLSTEDLKEEIGFKIQEEWNARSRKAMENQLMNHIINSNNFHVPDSLVWTVIVEMVKDIKRQYAKSPDIDKITPESMENELRPMASRTAKWEILRQRIIEKEGIEVEDHDIDPIVESEAEKYKTDKDTLKKKLLQNDGFVMSILSKKMMDLILDFAITSEISFEEYNQKYGQAGAGEPEDESMFPDLDDWEDEEGHEHEHHHDHDHGHDHDHHHHKH